MIYKELGSTGDEVSLLEFETMRLPQIELKDHWFVDEEKTVSLIREAVQQESIILIQHNFTAILIVRVVLVKI